MKRFIAKTLSGFITFLSKAYVSSASALVYHRPEVPKELLKK